VSQISPPVRILLAGAILFLAAWFTVLHPKAASTAAPAATPVATATATGTPTDGLGRAVAKARGAAATAETAGKAAAGESTQAQPQSQPQTGTATKSSPAQPAQPAVAIPAKVLAKLPTDVSAALKAHKTLVLGVISANAKPWRPLADDDRYVRNALRKVNRYDGQVLVKRVPVSSLVRYAPLVGGLDVNQTPSIVVIDGKLHGTLLTGYVDRISINQAIADARRNSISPLITDHYLRTLNTVCNQYKTALDRWSRPTIPGKKALRSSQKRLVGIYDRYAAVVARIAAPARWSSLKAQYAKDLRAAAGHGTFDAKSSRTLDARFDTLGVTSCVSNRRS
jgi:hypothetical protein